MAIIVDGLRTLTGSTALDSVLQAAIDTAVLVVDEDIRTSSVTQSEDRYDKITLYLAAHFLAIQNIGENGGLVKRSKLGEADESYEVPDSTLFGYNSTRWGQMAVVLDNSGVLAGTSAATGLKAQLRVV